MYGVIDGMIDGWLPASSLPERMRLVVLPISTSGATCRRKLPLAGGLAGRGDVLGATKTVSSCDHGGA